MALEFSTVVEQVNCRIRAFGRDLAPKEKVNQNPHKHYFMEFHYVFSGEETVLFPSFEQEVRLSAGQMLIIPKNIYHDATTRKETVERLCFNFIAETMDRSDSMIVDLCQRITRPKVISDPQIDILMEEYRRLQQGEKGLMTQTRQGLLLLNMVLGLLEQVAGGGTVKKQDNAHALRQKWIIEDYIEAHFADDTGLEGLAKALYISPRQTRKLVRQFLGEDFKTVIVRRRMETADIYLRDPDKTLEEIGWLVGYRSYSGFQLSFKKYFGVTPSQRRGTLHGFCGIDAEQ